MNDRIRNNNEDLSIERAENGFIVTIINRSLGPEYAQTTNQLVATNTSDLAAIIKQFYDELEAAQSVKAHEQTNF